MMPVRPAPRVMFASPEYSSQLVEPEKEVKEERPSGCPSLARAAPLTKTGSRDLKPKIVVDGSHFEIALSTRGWKNIRENPRAFSARAMHYSKMDIRNFESAVYLHISSSAAEA